MPEPAMKNYNNVHVSCAIIEHDGLVLAARRSLYMRLPLKWEFPGGKIGAQEDPQGCLLREIREELDMAVKIIAAFPPMAHQYSLFKVTLYPFICTSPSTSFILAEHAEAVWMHPVDLPGLDWAEADIPVLHAYLSWLAKGRP
jgi:8-oxo-dGTP diphosphatase